MKTCFVGFTERVEQKGSRKFVKSITTFDQQKGWEVWRGLISSYQFLTLTTALSTFLGNTNKREGRDVIKCIAL